MGGKSGVYHGIDYYLDHIKEEHRGSRNMGDVVLYKTGCIIDRVAEDTEEFDINLWPTDDGAGAKDRKQWDEVGQQARAERAEPYQLTMNGERRCV